MLISFVPELSSTVPFDGGRPSKVDEKLNGVEGSVNNVTPIAGPEVKVKPKLFPPSEKSPDWKLEGCPVAKPGSVGFCTTLVIMPVKSDPVRGGDIAEYIRAWEVWAVAAASKHTTRDRSGQRSCYYCLPHCD